MSNASRFPTYATCVERVLSHSLEPLTIEELVEGVRNHRPITKGARSAIDRALESLYQAVPLGDSRFGWLPHLLHDSTIRHTLEAEEMRQSFILLDELEHALFFPRFFQNLEAEERILHVDLFGEELLDAQLAARSGMWALVFENRFAQWLDDAGASPGDDLLITVVDAPAGRYSVRVQPVEARDESVIHERNADLARLAEELGQEILCRRSSLYTWQLVARLIGKGFFQRHIPPDDLHFVLEEYSRLHLVEGLGYELQLAESPSREQKRSAGEAPPKRSLRRDSEGTQRAQAPKSGTSLNTGKASRKTPDSNDPAERSRNSNGRIVFGPSRQRPNTQGKQGDAMKSPFESDEQGEDTCEAYEEYLAAYEEAHRLGEPLGHDDFHLLEAELESLVDLELEFGYLMADQNQRKMELAERLFIDPESLVDGN